MSNAKEKIDIKPFNILFLGDILHTCLQMIRGKLQKDNIRVKLITFYFYVSVNVKHHIGFPGGKFGGRSGGQSGLLVRTGPVL